MNLRNLRDDLPLEVRILNARRAKVEAENVARKKGREYSDAVKRVGDAEVVLAILEGQKRELENVK